MQKIPNRELNDIANFMEGHFSGKDPIDLPILAVAKLFKEMAVQSAEQRKNETEVSEADMLVINSVKDMLSYKVYQLRPGVRTKMKKENLQNKRDRDRRSLPTKFYI